MGEIHRLTSTWPGDGVVATVTRGRRTGHHGHPLTRRLLAVAAGRGERLVLDLSELVFVDVAGDLCHPGAPSEG